MMNSARIGISGFFHEPTNTVSYLVWDRDSGTGAVIDPVLDYDQAAGKVATRSAEAILQTAEQQHLRVEWVLETHAHADHLTAAPYVKRTTGAQIGIGEHIREVQRIFRPLFNLAEETDEACFDHLFIDGERFKLGWSEVQVMHVPGHTPADVAYVIEDAVFVGDTLFMPDYGTARADFPGGDAGKLYDSIQRLLSLPEHTRLFMCHDYKAPGRDHYAWETTVAAERNNVHIAGRSRSEFIAWRRARDMALAPPKLLYPSIQTNIRAGRLPEPEANGRRYLKIPITAEEDEAADQGSEAT
jgi:glyoxylase-like metal-dependent hydrolase (beta-lactamase superfamily II)